MRRYVIGDIHGCAKALRTLIETIQPNEEDEVIFLGDYIDRGPNSRDVVQQILELQQLIMFITHKILIKDFLH